MSAGEVVLGVAFGVFALVQAHGWYRDERQTAMVKRAHRADLAAIRAEAVRLGRHDEIRMLDVLTAPPVVDR